MSIMDGLVKRARTLSSETEKETKRVGAMPNAASDASASSQARPLCTFFARGACAYGETCTFRHEIQASDARAKTMPVCTFFLQGRCTRGDACTFTHPDRSSQPTQSARSPLLASAAQQPQAPLCTFYARGLCRNGDDCRFRHVDADVASEAKELQMFGADGEAMEPDANEEKATAQSGRDILRKYSMSTRARDAGLVVKVKRGVQRGELRTHPDVPARSVGDARIVGAASQERLISASTQADVLAQQVSHKVTQSGEFSAGAALEEEDQDEAGEDEEEEEEEEDLTALIASSVGPALAEESPAKHVVGSAEDSTLETDTLAMDDPYM
eukprot:TRINITY_DN8472_c0_g1_i1.p1 TRINITY_DN8472_c0_g1~~TRINITY_DN8472_c0_g1_i1.p1  ORF type:complete len:328 (-),score=55.60 TRINITY_DN8472_c0_g1_i1:243-1226(-)